MPPTDVLLNAPALVSPFINPEAVAEEDRRVLIVDDEAPVRELFAACLSERYLCATATNAEEALAHLAAETYALVLTDVSMP
ncbi:MAG TPA: response regulator, partial [Pyrinomonadaceae bacterium]|nr:response regulator [Pyrinomonadaceae bacterium]